MEKELKQIEEDYNALGAAQKGGSSQPYIDPNNIENIYKKIINPNTKINNINYIGGGDAGEDKKSFAAKQASDFKKTGTGLCKSFVGKGVFKNDWSKYQRCVLDYLEGAPKDGANIVEQAKKIYTKTLN